MLTDTLTRAGAVATEARHLVEEGIELAARRVERARAEGVWQRPLDFERDRLVLLFYEDVESDRWVRGDRHVKRAARRLVHAARRTQRVTGFGIAYAALRTALEREGYTIRENDWALARANPRYPVGMCGYPHILDLWDLPNPAILGPGLLDHPKLRPGLLADRRFDIDTYLVPCAWMKDLFGKTYPVDRIAIFFAGLDTAAWPDLAGHPKDLDFIVYDKIRWDIADQEKNLVAPVLAELDRRGLSYKRLIYKRYDHETYRALLARSRGLIFLCEHETQGLAYQEAMASNVPVLAWDCGEWRDPVRFRFGDAVVPGSSVPYFDARCGEKFVDAAAFPAALDRFVERRESYTPRVYVHEKLSLEASARAYLDVYRRAAERGKRG